MSYPLTQHHKTLRRAWIKLGDMNKAQAQEGLVRLLHNITPHIKDYVLEQWRHRQLEAGDKGEECVLNCCIYNSLVDANSKSFLAS